MKKLFSIAIVCLFAMSTQAQNNPPVTPPSTTKGTPTQVAPTPIQHAAEASPQDSHDRLMMRDGKVWVSRGGQTTLLTRDITLSDGTKVMSDGTYTTKDGKKMKMNNGDVLGFDGKLIEAEKVEKAPSPQAAPNK